MSGAKGSDLNGYPAVFIDDTGTPGQVSKSQHLHPNRKTWVAVCMTAEQAVKANNLLAEVSKKIFQKFGADELHFVDIWNRNGKYATISDEDRLFFFESFGKFFESEQYPILVQTFSPDTINDHAPLPEVQIRPLQMADFAAFVVNRSQWILAKDKMSKVDRSFIDIIGRIRLNLINLKSIEVDPEKWKSSDYDAHLETDRIQKGLSSRPWKKDDSGTSE